MNNFNSRNMNNNCGRRRERRGKRTRKGYSGYDPPHNEGDERNFKKFVDMEHSNKDSENWHQNDWRYNNFHGNPCPSGSGGAAGIFPWQRKNAVNPLIIPPQVPNFVPIHNDNICNDREVVDPNMQQPSTAIGKKNENNNTAISSTTPRSRNNSMSVNNQNTDNTVPPPAKNVDHKISPVTKSKPSIVETKCNIKIKEEKKETIKLKQEKEESSSSSSSSSSEDTSSDEEQELPKNPSAIKTQVVKPTTTNTQTATGKTSLNIKLKPQQKPATLSKFNHDIKVPAPSSSSSSTSSSSDEESAPPPVPAPKQVNIPNVKPIIKPVEESEKKKNSSEDDVVCMGQLENKIVLEDDDEAPDSDSNDEMQESTTVIKPKKTNKTEQCMICDKKGHSSFQCQMICKNCSEPYHGFRTCPHPANLNTMLQQFMEFCMQQIQSYKPDKQFTLQNGRTKSSSETITQPQVDSSFTSNKTKNSKLKRKQVKTKELNTKLNPNKMRKLLKTKKRLSEEPDEDAEDDSDTSPPEDNDSSDPEDFSSLSGSLSAANSTKKKLKTIKSKNNSMSAFNLANFIPNPVNLPMVLNGFPSLPGVHANVTANPNASTNALNTLLLTQMFQNAIGSLKQ